MTGIDLPCRCTACGYVFVPAFGGIRVAGAVSASFSGNTYAPCPLCGGVCKFLEGTFSTTAELLDAVRSREWQTDDVARVRSALATALQIARSGNDVGAIREVERADPRLGRTLWDLSGSGQVQTLIAVLGVILMIVFGVDDDGHDGSGLSDDERAEVQQVVEERLSQEHGERETPDP